MYLIKLLRSQDSSWVYEEAEKEIKQKGNKPCNLCFPIKVMAALFNDLGQIMSV